MARGLYVALAGLDAVAVIDARDPLHLHRLGLIPTGWSPSALALAPTIARSSSSTNTGSVRRTARPVRERVWSTLQRIDLADVKLADTTRATLGCDAQRGGRAAGVAGRVAQRRADRRRATTTSTRFSATSGTGRAIRASRSFGAAVTPNLHALARRFGAGRQHLRRRRRRRAAQADRWSRQRVHRRARRQCATAAVRSASRTKIRKTRRGWARCLRELARHDLSFRDYGGFLDVSGDGPGRRSRKTFPRRAVARRSRRSRIIRRWNVACAGRAARGGVRARLTERSRSAHRQPRFAYVQLPSGPDGGAGLAPRRRPLRTVTAHSARSSTSSRTCRRGARPRSSCCRRVRGSGRDHVDASRTFALVISPYAKHGYVGMRHLSTASVLKTIDRLFELPPLSLGDLLANDMGDFFGPRPDVAPVRRRPYKKAGRGERTMHSARGRPLSRDDEIVRAPVRSIRRRRSRRRRRVCALGEQSSACRRSSPSRRRSPIGRCEQHAILVRTLRDRGVDVTVLEPATETPTEALVADCAILLPQGQS